MKVMFIEAKSKEDITEVINKFKEKGKIGLVSSVQYLNQLGKAQKLIPNSIIAGQVLGCKTINAIKIKKDVDKFLYIGSAYFHPIKIAIDTNKEVYIANPLTNEISKINEKEIQDFKNRIKGRQAKYLMSKNPAFIVSTKPGQNKLKVILNRKEKYPIFICNNLDLNELENFSEIDYWINTACNRIEGKNIINLEDLPKDNEK
jgi:2-(3-amino-3-carboxypropyl)histidine synthase